MMTLPGVCNIAQKQHTASHLCGRKGNILTQASITINDNVTLIGRALARTAAVTLRKGVNITLP